MAHSFPAGLQTLLASGWARWNPFIEITLSTGTVLRYSTVNITVDGNTYVNKLLKIGGGKISSTRNVDRLSLTLDGTLPNDAQTIVVPHLHKAKAVVGSIYVNIRNSADAHRVVLDDGVVSTLSADDLAVELLFISSTYTEKTHSGDLPVMRSCAYKYKGTECGYSGSLPSCDLTFDGPNGCRAHFPEATALLRFGGHGVFMDAKTEAENHNPPVPGGGGDPNIATGLPDRNDWSPYYF